MNNSFDFLEQLYSCFHFDFIEDSIDNCILNGHYNNSYAIGNIDQLVDYNSPFWSEVHYSLSAQPQYGDIGTQIVSYLNSKIFGPTIINSDPHLFMNEGAVYFHTGAE
jgi:hypothetical protein